MPASSAGRSARSTRPAAVACLLMLLAAVTAAAEEVVCSDCHDEASAAVAESVHGWLECLDCHPGADSPDHPEGMAAVACGGCHEDSLGALATSVHSRADLGPEGRALACADCHGPAHDLRSSADEAAPTHASNLVATCGACHANPDLAERFRLRLVRPVEAYEAGVHARAVARGDPGPDCHTCHSSHDIVPAADPRSPVHHARVPETCGGCHREITEAYQKSVHGEAAARGIRESPVCTDCHGEHRILSPREPGSPVYATNIPKMTCGRCHADLRLSDKFGLPAEKVPAYEDSFHGLAMRTGRATVAQCASCHGVHDILPSSDPRSHIHRDRLAETCGHCHPGAGTRFAIGPVHVLADEPQHVAVYWVRRIYLWLIFLVIGGMLVHNALDLYRKSAGSRDLLPAAPVVAPERMSRMFRLTHGVLMASFIVLVYTGFALKYPESWWSAPLLRWESSLGLRGWIHRVAAVAMLGAGALHLVHLAIDRRARGCIAAMRPRRSDLQELAERLQYYLGRRRLPPEAPWLGYGEKAEYLAVIWGTVIMAVTGFLLWFETAALRWLPSWALDVATVVHFYEAILASLAILVWHCYAVIFDPLVYPMDPAWLTGRSAPGRAQERAAPEPTPEPGKRGRGAARTARVGTT